MADETFDPEEMVIVVDPNELAIEDKPEPKIRPWKWAPEKFFRYDPANMVILPTGSSFPMPVPPEFAHDQPYVSTCSKPKPGNAGCGVWTGCKFREWAEKMRAMGLAPWNGVMETPEGAQDGVWCFEAYTGVFNGKWTNPLSRLLRKWKFITHKTTITRTRGVLRVNPQTGERGADPIEIEDPIERPGPMYAHLTGHKWPFRLEKPKLSPASSMHDAMNEDESPRPAPIRKKATPKTRRPAPKRKPSTKKKTKRP